MKKNYDEKLLPRSLKDYLARIDAKVINFKSFVVEQWDDETNYCNHKCMIKISAEGELSCSDEEFAPTSEEMSKIKMEWCATKFPERLDATEANFKKLAKDIGAGSTLYKFFTRTRSAIIMVQQRYVAEKTGKKGFRSWTFWSDGVWRPMEPDKLPFWKPSERRNKQRIMVHEGAKTAEFIDGLLHDPARKEELAVHPWKDEIKNYEHWGMIGGAKVPYRSDYSELIMEGLREAVYVCDNDSPGKSVLKKFSKNYGKSVKGVMFDDSFPLSWDMADPFPPEKFSEQGHYIGKPLFDYMEAATHATKVIPNPAGKGRPIFVIKDEFVDEWCHCIEPEVYVHREWPDTVLSANGFNNKVRPYSDVEDTARLVRTDSGSKTAVIKYNPGRKSGVFISEDGKRYINTHIPSSIKPIKGDYGPWEEFIDFLVVEKEDRINLKRWCATLIARPDIRMHYSVLLISDEQGVGKGTLGEKILAPLVGVRNVSVPTEKELIDSQFNSWAAEKRLVIVHEIYAGHSSKAYDALKTVIVDGLLTVNKKYQASYQVESWVHILACSNSDKPLRVAKKDRRWFIPEITNTKRPPEYWDKFNKWLTQDQGLNKIAWWAKEFLKTNTPVLTSEQPPATRAKRRLIEAGYSPGQKIILQFLERAKEELNGQDVIIIDLDLVKVIKDHLYEGRLVDRLERPTTIQKLAKEVGWFVGVERAQFKDWGTAGTFARIISNDEKLASMRPAELAKNHRPMDVAKKAQEWLNYI